MATQVETMAGRADHERLVEQDQELRALVDLLAEMELPGV